MDIKERDRFLSLWSKYFGDEQLPIAIFFSDEGDLKISSVPERGACIISLLPDLKKGETLCFSAKSKVCGGAHRYLGFAAEVPMANFEYFLSYGIPGKLEGERYKKSPELVREGMMRSPPFMAPKPFIVFKRWDKLTSSDEPDIVVFLANLDTIAGLFTLANFDEADPNSVICPFGSGCSSIVYHPYAELRTSRPRCVIGMFDISARPYVGENSLSFAVPYPKFKRMVEDMDESFLTTDSWKTLRRNHRRDK